METAEHSMRFELRDLLLQSERCRREIAECEMLLRSGHPDMEGLCLALSDWSTELRIIHGFERAGAEAERPSDTGGEPVEASPANE